jgi:hypothetical protein
MLPCKPSVPAALANAAALSFYMISCFRASIPSKAIAIFLLSSISLNLQESVQNATKEMVLCRDFPV